MEQDCKEKADKAERLKAESDEKATKSRIESNHEPQIPNSNPNPYRNPEAIGQARIAAELAAKLAAEAEIREAREAAEAEEARLEVSMS